MSNFNFIVRIGFIKNYGKGVENIQAVACFNSYDRAKSYFFRCKEEAKGCEIYYDIVDKKNIVYDSFFGMEIDRDFIENQLATLYYPEDITEKMQRMTYDEILYFYIDSLDEGESYI